LLIVHELLAVEVVEQHSDLGVFLIAKIEPKLLDLNGGIIHVVTEILHGQTGFDALAQDLGINDLDPNSVVVGEYLELEPLVVDRILKRLTLSLTNIYGLNSIIDGPFQSHLDVWPNHALGETSDLHHIEQALLLE
jgi:hypothetical protein